MTTLATHTSTFILAESCCLSRTGVYNMVRKSIKKTTRCIWKITNYSELLAQVKQNSDAVIIINSNLIGLNPMQSLSYIRQTYPQTKLILTSLYFSHYYHELYAQGILSSYLLTSQALPADYVNAISQSLDGEQFLPLAVKEIAMQSKHPIHQLNQDEWQIFYHYINCLNLKEIATKTSSHISKVNRTIEKIRNLTGHSRIIDLIKFAMAHNLITHEMFITEP